MNNSIVVFTVALFLSIFTVAKPINVLFVGNSFTYEPGNILNPALPENFKRIALSLNTDIQVEYVVKGGQTFKRHVDEGEVAKKLLSMKYDFVIVQAQSIEALELPRCFAERGGPVGRREFLEYSKKLISLIDANGATPVIFAHWTYQKDHPWLRDDFPCLKFATNEVNAGKKWFGANLIQYQQMLNEGFALAAVSSSVKIQSNVGSKWWELMNDRTGYVTDTDLYQADNFHPTAKGSFFSAMVLVRDILKLDMNLLNNHPIDITESQFKLMKDILYK